MKKWVCNVCGYVHEGEKPPEVCPICGVGPEDFTLMDTPDKVEPDKKAKKAKQWKCTVCDYIHEGDEPPETCPVCGVGKEFFILLGDEIADISPEAVATADESTMNAALNEISYGLYIVSSTKDGKINGQTANTVFQLTSQPPQIGVCVNKQNLTNEYIASSGLLAISIVSQEDMETPRLFGYRSGRTVDKYADVDYVLGKNGCPIVKKCISYIEAEVIPEKTADLGTHILFVAKVTAGRKVADVNPMTYAFYRQAKKSAKK